jgi:ArsR family transcriptional regulator
LWQAVESELSDAMVEADRTRCEAVLQARGSAGSWLDAVAGEMERHYSPGRTWESFVHGFAGLLRLGDVLDVGSGDGALAAVLAPWSKSVTCVDGSERMIEAARRRLASSPNVRCVLGDMHALPFGEAEFDQVALFNVLTYSQEPGRAVTEAARVLRRGGRVVILTLRHHEHLSAAAGYGHVQPGFRLTTVKRWLSAAGLAVAACNVVARERKRPHFEVILAVAEKSAS